LACITIESVAYSYQDVLLAFERFKLVSVPLTELEAAQITSFTSPGNEIWIHVLPDDSNAAEAEASALQWAVAPKRAVQFDRIDVENVAVLFNPRKRRVVEGCLEALRRR
jgi:hypothetical protein